MFLILTSQNGKTLVSFNTEDISVIEELRNRNGDSIGCKIYTIEDAFTVQETFHFIMSELQRIMTTGGCGCGK